MRFYKQLEYQDVEVFSKNWSTFERNHEKAVCNTLEAGDTATSVGAEPTLAAKADDVDTVLAGATASLVTTAPAEKPPPLPPPQPTTTAIGTLNNGPPPRAPKQPATTAATEPTAKSTTKRSTRVVESPYPDGKKRKNQSVLEA